MSSENYYNGKHDDGKLPISMVPPGIIEAVSLVRAYGNIKYKDPNNWKTVVNAETRYWDAMMRHLIACQREGIMAVDQESGIPNLFHAACNMAFLIELFYGADFDGTVFPWFTKEEWEKMEGR